jgi:hypothetical protein
MVLYSSFGVDRAVLAQLRDRGGLRLTQGLRHAVYSYSSKLLWYQELYGLELFENTVLRFVYVDILPDKANAFPEPSHRVCANHV